MKRERERYTNACKNEKINPSRWCCYTIRRSIIAIVRNIQLPSNVSVMIWICSSFISYTELIK